MAGMGYVILALVALLAAATVALLALTQAPPRTDGERPLRAFRSGLRARRNPDPDLRAAVRAAKAEPVDVTLAEMFRANVEYGGGYLRPEEIVETWQAAAERVLPGHRGDATG